MRKVGCLVNMAALIVGFLVGLVLKVDLAGVVKQKKGDFKFCIESDTWGVSLCFISLHIVALLWNYIQYILG